MVKLIVEERFAISDGLQRGARDLPGGWHEDAGGLMQKAAGGVSFGIGNVLRRVDDGFFPVLEQGFQGFQDGPVSCAVGHGDE
jgi:hypothetical protein